MGWTTFNKSKHISPSDYFRSTFANEPNHELLDIAIVKRMTAYMAVRLKDTNEVICFVYLLTYDHKSYHNFGYKDMTEFCGPCQAECPKRILDLLTPLEDKEENNWAIEWRKRCYAKIDKKASLPKVKVGQIIKLEEPIGFTNGGEYQYFKKQERINRWVGMFIDKAGELVVSYSTVRFIASNFKYEIVDDKPLISF